MPSDAFAMGVNGNVVMVLDCDVVEMLKISRIGDN
jgi:hypothetical protein